MMWNNDRYSPRGLISLNIAAHEFSVEDQVAAVRAYAGRKGHDSLVRILQFVRGVSIVYRA
jgi:hypothetical protein